MEELAAREIPFIVTGLNVLETATARDLLALARAVCYENDADSLFRVCALPHFKISGAELREKLAVSGAPRNFRGVLQTLDSAARVLADLRGAREIIFADKRTGAAGAFKYLVRQFEFSETDAVVQAVLRFASAWEEKPFTQDTSLPEFLQDLQF